MGIFSSIFSRKKENFKLSQLKPISLGGNFSLIPVDSRILMEDGLSALPVLYNVSPDIKEYLPNVDFSDVEKAKIFFTEHILATEARLLFMYSIRMGKGYVGFVIVNTPEYNRKTINFPEWTLDFFLFSPFENKHVMSSVLVKILALLKIEMHVKEVYALVDKRNVKCQALLSKFYFEERDNSHLLNTETGVHGVKLCCNLSEINFKGR